MGQFKGEDEFAVPIEVGAALASGSFFTDTKTVATPGTAVQCPVHAIPRGFLLVVHADPDNIGNVYIGESAAQAQAHKLTLTPDSVATLALTNSNLVWIDADRAGEGVELMAEQ